MLCYQFSRQRHLYFGLIWQHSHCCENCIFLEEKTCKAAWHKSLKEYLFSRSKLILKYVKLLYYIIIMYQGNVFTVKPRFKGPLFKGLPLFKGQISADQFSLQYINYPHLRDYPDLRNSLLLTKRSLK